MLESDLNFVNAGNLMTWKEKCNFAKERKSQYMKPLLWFAFYIYIRGIFSIYNILVDFIVVGKEHDMVINAIVMLFDLPVLVLVVLIILFALILDKKCYYLIMASTIYLPINALLFSFFFGDMYSLIAQIGAIIMYIGTFIYFIKRKDLFIDYTIK